MPEVDIGQAQVTSSTIVDYSVDPMHTEAAGEQKETTWMNTKFTQYFGYFKTIPELNSAINAKATWTVGKGVIADKMTTFILQGITGNGKDTFNTILENMIRTYNIGGDAYCEIIRAKDGELINLKPLDPTVMRHVANRKGRLIRFEQVSKTKKSVKRFKPEEIFYLPRNRVADEIHGSSVIAAVENIILMRNEALADWKRVLHRNVDPMWIIHADTDDPEKIAKVRRDWEAIKKNSETWIVPKGVIVPELVATAPNASLNPLAWIQLLTKYFFEAVGVPRIIVGGSEEFTEASAKIAYLAFQQTIEEEQLFIEEQVGLQLGMTINLEFPASLENEMLSDKPKVEERGMTGDQAMQPNDTTAETEGQR